MPKLYLTDTLLQSLRTFSDAELRDLEDLLRRPDFRAILADILADLRSLRGTERHLSSSRRSTATSDNDADVQPPEIIGSTSLLYEDAIEAIPRLLSDRSIFPTTRHVLAAINTALPIQLDYDQYRRSGRRPAIRQCTHRLQQMSPKERRSAFHKLVKFAQNMSEHAAPYLQLFSALLGR